VYGETGGHQKLVVGVNDVEIFAGVPKYVQVNLKGRKAPGKLSFDTLGTSYVAYVSYEHSKPDQENRTHWLNISKMKEYQIKSSFEEQRSSIAFDHDVVYIGLYSQKDCYSQITLTVKTNKRFDYSATKDKSQEVEIMQNRNVSQSLKSGITDFTFHKGTDKTKTLQLDSILQKFRRVAN